MIPREGPCTMEITFWYSRCMFRLTCGTPLDISHPLYLTSDLEAWRESKERLLLGLLHGILLELLSKAYKPATPTSTARPIPLHMHICNTRKALSTVHVQDLCGDSVFVLLCSIMSMTFCAQLVASPTACCISATDPSACGP